MVIIKNDMNAKLWNVDISYPGRNTLSSSPANGRFEAGPELKRDRAFDIPHPLQTKRTPAAL